MPVMTPGNCTVPRGALPAGRPPGIPSSISTTRRSACAEQRSATCVRAARFWPDPDAMVDCGFYLLLLSRLGPVALAVTTNLNINFMRKPEPGDLLGEGRLLKLGKTLAVGDFTIWSEGRKSRSPMPR